MGRLITLEEERRSFAVTVKITAGKLQMIYPTLVFIWGKTGIRKIVIALKALHWSGG